MWESNKILLGPTWTNVSVQRTRFDPGNVLLVRRRNDRQRLYPGMQTYGTNTRSMTCASAEFEILSADLATLYVRRNQINSYNIGKYYSDFNFHNNYLKIQKYNNFKLKFLHTQTIPCVSFLYFFILLLCAILPPSFGGKGPYLRRWLVTQPSSDGLLAEVIRGFPLS
jgi:hypothetical protein